MSSIAPQTLSHEDDRPVLAFSSPSAKPSLERVLDELFQKLSSLEPTIHHNLEEADEAQLLKVWNALGKVERFTWVGKCGVCARLWEKTTEAKRGRGHKDATERGILAAVSRTSKKFSITPSMVYLQARIFRLIKSVEQIVGNSYTQYNILDILNKQGYWEQALNAADPVKAILHFAHLKNTLPRFRPTDAERLVLTPEFSRKAVALKAVEQVREKAGYLEERQTLIQHIRSSQDVIRNLIMPSCPDEDFKARFWEETLLSLDDEYNELFEEDAFVALRRAWNKGLHREDQLAEATTLPLVDVSKLMKSLCDMSEFIPIQVRDIKKRSQYQLWHKVGEPFDNTLLMPMKERE